MDLYGNEWATMRPFSNGEKINVVEIPYRQAVSSLLYISVSTRPGVTNTVSVLTQFKNNAEQVHRMTVKRVLKYFKQTEYYGLLLT